MSLHKNVVASYASQIYVTLIGIAIVPLYVRMMGAEAYGLVGFFTMLQAWFQLLDMGLTPTMARETARFNAGAGDAHMLRRLLRILEIVFFALAVIGGLIMIMGADFIARSWLQPGKMPLTVVSHAIMLIAVTVSLRWVCGLYRGAINGFERVVWLAGFNTVFATIRFVVVLPVLYFLGATPVNFFTYQAIVAVVELGALMIAVYRWLPRVSPFPHVAWQWKQLRSVLRFSLGIAFTGAVWVLVTQTDKLVLSKLLSLEQYAYFTLAVLLASGVMVISGPISTPLLPRLTRLAAVGDDMALVNTYRSASQLVAVIAIPTSLVLAFFSQQILWVWTGDAVIARTAAPVLTLYAIGNGMLAMSGFAYYLQFAKGDLKLHVIGHALFLVFLIPSLIWGTMNFGVRGAGYAWVAANALYLFIWVPLVHARIVKGMHRQWLFEDLAPVFWLALVSATGAYSVITWPRDRTLGSIVVVGLSAAILLIAAGGSKIVRGLVAKRFHAYWAYK